MFLIEGGHLFGCGWNHRNQLAIKDTANKPTLTAITLESDAVMGEIVDIACGWDSTAAIDSNGSLFVWGSNAFGQIGFPLETVKCTHRPHHLVLPEGRKVREVSFGLHFLAIWTQDNRIYFVGRIKTIELDCSSIEWNGGKCWQLNVDETKMKRLDGLKFIASGQRHFTFAVADEDESLVYGVGDNRFEQRAPVRLPGGLSRLRCGWTHNAAMAGGCIFLWGRNTYGQLASSDTELSGLQQVRCEDSDAVELYLGAEHCVAVSEQGAVYTWGWNEHGNCGNGSVDNV